MCQPVYSCQLLPVGRVDGPVQRLGEFGCLFLWRRYAHLIIWLNITVRTFGKVMVSGHTTREEVAMLAEVAEGQALTLFFCCDDW